MIWAVYYRDHVRHREECGSVDAAQVFLAVAADYGDHFNIGVYDDSTQTGYFEDPSAFLGHRRVMLEEECGPILHTEFYPHPEWEGTKR